MSIVPAGYERDQGNQEKRHTFLGNKWITFSLQNYASLASLVTTEVFAIITGDSGGRNRKLSCRIRPPQQTETDHTCVLPGLD